MRTLSLTQGSPEWHAHRLSHFNASDAPAMMGASKYKTRQQLLAECAGAAPEEMDAGKQYLFNKGHVAEAAARPHIEALIGEELFPAVGVSDEHPKLSASFDGVTMDERTGYECKLWSEGLAAQVREKSLEPHYVWQLEQQALVGNLERIIFCCASEDGEKREVMEYRPQPGLREQLLAGWAQFERDLADYKPAAVTVEAIGHAPESLPALRIEVTGMVTASNLVEFKQRAIEVFRGIRTDLQTDQDFADADKTVKWCGEIEDKLKAAKEHALGQTASIDELFRAIDAISAEARSKRLELEKLVKARKEAVRFEIVQRAREALTAHIQTINATLADVAIQIPTEFLTGLATAMKGKKTVASLQDAADTAVAHAKIAVSQQADAVRLNLKILAEASHPSLFGDRQALALGKQPDDLRNLVAARIAKYEQDEAERIERDRARIREEEAQKLRAAAPVATPASAPTHIAPTPKPRMRADGPTVEQVTALVASHYGVDTAQAAAWLARMNFNLTASQKLASNY